MKESQPASNNLVEFIKFATEMESSKSKYSYNTELFKAELTTA
jgi:hypothetical protein